MRKIIIFGIVVILLSTFTCHLPLQEETVLSSGTTTVTSEEKVKLDALQPEVDRILSEVLGDSVESNGVRKINSPEQALEIKERVTNLLKANFGEDYRKFITEKELAPTSVVKASSISELKDQISKSGPVQKSVSGNSILLIGEIVIFSEFNLITYKYRMMITVNKFSSPYFSFNYATQKIIQTKFVSSTSITSAYPVDNQSLSIVDQGIYSNYNSSNESSCSAIGVVVLGPKTASSIITYHNVVDPRVYNGNYWYGCQWGN
jgi:hypothetical protein